MHSSYPILFYYHHTYEGMTTMNLLSYLLPGLVFITGPIIGVIGGLIGSSFHQKILHDIQRNQYPKDPTEKYSLIAKRCPYARSWTRMDTYNLSVFLGGCGLLIVSIIISILELSKKEITYLGTFPMLYPLLILSFILILLGGMMIVQRFLMILKLIQIQAQPDKNIIESAIPFPKGKPGSRQMVLGIGMSGLIYGIWSTYTALTNSFILFVIGSVAFSIIMLVFSIHEYRRRKRN